jgi:hypothetical protein
MSEPSRPFTSSGPQSDLEALLIRMRQRLYPETVPVLVSYWLRTVYYRGYKRGWWKELDELLKRILREEFLNTPSHEALIGVQAWIRQAGLLNGQTTAVLPLAFEPFRANMRAEQLAPYITRLLNSWLWEEVASLLVEDTEFATRQDRGIPVRAVGRALGRLLARERLSPETLEMLLQPELLSPRYVYPADAEMLRDVVLAMLGRTSAPAAQVMPAALFSVVPAAPLPPNYGEAVGRASYERCQGGEEVRVPIAATEALSLLQGDPVRIASIVVTMDGRWWWSDNVQSGAQSSIVYKPGERLRIDYASEHATLKVPWPETRLSWQGTFPFPNPLEIFGREWRVSSWEADGEHSTLHLVFSRALPITEVRPAADSRLRRSHPASIDMAWAGLENAIAASISQKSLEPLRELRRSEFVPLGRAIFEFAESVKSGTWRKRDTIEIKLNAIRYLQSEISLVYGRVPWRILPARVRATVLKRSLAPALLELLNEVFEGFPEALAEGTSQRHPVSRETRAVPPSRAA